MPTGGRIELLGRGHFTVTQNPPHFLFSGGGVSDVHKGDVPQIDQVTGSVRSGVRPHHITTISATPTVVLLVFQLVLICSSLL